MAFFVYFAVLIFAAATAMFGLDLLVAPLPTKPNVHNVYFGTTRTAPGPKTEEEKRADRALSPVYAASPGVPKAEAGKAAIDAGSVEPAPPPTQAQVDRQPSPPSVQEDADQQAASDKALTAAAQADHPPGCNVEACASAYQSFRASDCTFQPHEGPRRICTTAPASAVAEPGQKKVERATPPPAENTAPQQLRNVALHRHNAQRTTMPTDEDSDPRQSDRTIETVEEDYGRGLIPGLFGFGQRRRVIVIERGPARAEARSCNVSACSRAYGTFNILDCSYQPAAGARRQCDK